MDNRNIKAKITILTDIIEEDEEECDESFVDNKKNTDQNALQISSYSMKYRVIKTGLIMLAWVSLGMCIELYGPSLQNLKIKLGANYQKMTRLVISRYTAYIISTAVFSILLKKLTNILDLLVGLSKLVISLAVFSIPLSNTYTLTLTLYFVKGIFQALFNLATNVMIFKLWSGISESPVNFIYGGYCFGGAIAFLIVKLFIRFKMSQEELTTQQIDEEILSNISLDYTNMSSFNSNNKRLQTPFSIIALFSLFIAICCLIAHFFEVANTKKYANRKRSHHKQNGIDPKSAKKSKSNRSTCLSKVGRLLFDEEIKELNQLIVKLTMFSLIVIICLNFGGFFTIFTNFQFTYLTHGPAKFPISYATTVMTSYWFAIFISIVFSVFIGYKLNPLSLFSMALFIVFVLSTLAILPQFNSNKSFVWLNLIVFGIANAPLYPASLMIVNHIFMRANSVIISSVHISFILGGICAQYMTGLILDKLKPTQNWWLADSYNNPKPIYIIPVIIFINLLISLLVYLLLLVIYYKSKQASLK